MKNDGSLSVKLFNNVDIMYEGKSIFKEKQLTAKLKSLLQYFLINHSSVCKPDKIIEDIWPDNEYNERKKVLQTYVHRLRNAFSKDNAFNMDFSDKISIINSKGNYIFNVSDDIVFDTDILVELAKETEGIKDYQELMNMTKRLGAVYDGHFLQDCPQEKMAIRQRNYYLQIYCGAIANILEKLRDMEKYDDIISICESFFKLEELDNLINTIFLSTLIKTQQINYAVRHYSYLEDKMKTTYGIPMPAELTAIIKDCGNVDFKASEEKLDPEDQMKSMISNLISERLRDAQVVYSFAQITLKTKKDKNIDGSIIEIMLKNSLRKNDMYTIISSKSAMALLYELKEEHFNTIKQRIISYISRNYSPDEMTVEVEIWPVTNIL